MTIQLEIGDILQDNDPRQEGRTVEIRAILPNGVSGMSYPKGAFVTIRRDRIYTDGKPRKSGFSLVIKGVKS
jgi:hypothetical protein